MSLFSQRKGITPLNEEFQRESIDDELRNGLWSAVKIVVWDQWTHPNHVNAGDIPSKKVTQLLDSLWLSYFKWPLDTRPLLAPNSSPSKSAYQTIRQYFFEAKWHEVYDFIEFVIKHIPSNWQVKLSSLSNSILEDENAAYRIIENEIVEITDEAEIKAIEEALDTKKSPTHAHLKRALELLSDKKNPDYRNSIKESVSAVEACCQDIVGDSKASLGEALKKLKNISAIHPALEKGFSSIYGYTSDSGGIRHALTEGEQAPSYADAKFMLVACSSFINFMVTKTAEGKR